MGQTKTQLIDGETTKTGSADQPEIKTTKAKKAKIRGKAFKNAKSQIDSSKLHTVKQAVELVKQTSFTKFDSSVELHLVVNKEGLSATTELPNSTGKSKAIEIADENTIKKLEKGQVDFDILLTTADMMPKLVKFARLLGPKGMMPNPKNGTIIKSAKDAEKFKGNSITIKTEKKAPLIHQVVGKVSMDVEKLAQNVNATLDAVGKRRIKKAYLSATMSPSVKVDLN